MELRRFQVRTKAIIVAVTVPNSVRPTGGTLSSVGGSGYLSYCFGVRKFVSKKFESFVINSKL